MLKIKNISDIHRCKTLEKKLSKYKLWGNLVPENTFNINLRTILSKEEWYILEKAVYKKANYNCYICGATTPKLEIHEEWLYDYNTLKQQLNEINALCDLCYLNKHLEKKINREKSILHWSIVNNEDYNNFEKYEKLVREFRDLRNEFDWKVVDHLGNDITKGVKLYNLLKLVAKDYKGEYVPNSQNKETHFKSLRDICDQFEKNISELKEIKIYKWNKYCWKCHKETPHVSYCLVFQGVVLGCIGDVKKLDEILLKEYSFVKRVYSKTQGRGEIGNACIYCGAYHRNYFIFDEILHHVNEEDLDKTIPNILNDEDLPLIISLLAELEKEFISKSYKTIDKNGQKGTYYLKITKNENEYFEIEFEKSVIESSDIREKKSECSPKFYEIKNILLELLKSKDFEIWSYYLTITGHTDDIEYISLVGDNLIESVIPIDKVDSTFEDLLIWNLYFQKNDINYALKISDCTKKIKMTSGSSLEDIIDDIEKLSDLKEIRIYKWKKACWKCWKVTPRVSYCLSFSFGGHMYHIGEIEKLDKILMREYPFVKYKYSYTKKETVIANCCIHCGVYQGNYFIMDEIIHYVGEENVDKTIPNFLSEEDLGLSKEFVEFFRVLDEDLPPSTSWLAELEDNDKIDYTSLNDIDFLYDLGIDYMYRRSYEYAIKIFEKILQIEPKDSDALAYIGKVYAEKLDYDKAIEIFRDLVEKGNDDSISDTDILQLLIAQKLVSRHYDIRDQGYLGYLEDWNYLNIEDTTGIYEIRIAYMDQELEKEGFEALAYIISLKNLIIEVLNSENIEVYTHYHVLLDVFELIPEKFIAEGSYIPLEKAITEYENLCPLRIFCVKDSLHYIIEVKKYSGNEYDYTWG